MREWTLAGNESLWCRCRVPQSSGYFYVAQGIGLLGRDEVKSLGIGDFEAAGKHFCQKSWRDVAAKYAESYCFGSAYIPALLRAYGVVDDNSKTVTFARKIRGFSIGWTLGAQIFFLRQQRCEIATFVRLPSQAVTTEGTPKLATLGALIAASAGGVIGGLCFGALLLWSRERLQERASAIPMV